VMARQKVLLGGVLGSWKVDWKTNVWYRRTSIWVRISVCTQLSQLIYFFFVIFFDTVYEFYFPVYPEDGCMSRKM
jgi:hypothetical protein